MWRCPTCKAEFKNEHQWHSCLRTEVDVHFKGKPDAFVLIFDDIIRLLEKLGEFNVRSVPSAIIFKKKSSFAAVKLQKKVMILEWMTNRLIDDDERIVKTLQTSAHRFAHVVKIAERKDFDKQLRAYLTEAYEACT